MRDRIRQPKPDDRINKNHWTKTYLQIFDQNMQKTDLHVDGAWG